MGQSGFLVHEAIMHCFGGMRRLHVLTMQTAAVAPIGLALTQFMTFPFLVALSSIHPCGGHT